jgi:hypothetical protein
VDNYVGNVYKGQLFKLANNDLFNKNSLINKDNKL